MTAKERVLQRERQRGYEAAKLVQANALDMTGTELYAVNDRIPAFLAARAKMNMLERPVGFVCRHNDYVYQLDAPYDSDTHTGTPDQLPSQFRLKHTTDPKKARPFVSYDVSRSQYDTGDCCTHNGHVWCSGQDANTWEPGTINVKWDDLGTIEEVQG